MANQRTMRDKLSIKRLMIATALFAVAFMLFRIGFYSQNSNAYEICFLAAWGLIGLATWLLRIPWPMYLLSIVIAQITMSILMHST